MELLLDRGDLSMFRALVSALPKQLFDHRASHDREVVIRVRSRSVRTDVQEVLQMLDGLLYVSVFGVRLSKLLVSFTSL